MHTTTQAVPNIPVNPAGAPRVSWGAIIAGALGATIISALLVLLGLGIGLVSNLSEGAGMASLGWIVVTQIIAAAVGGYLAGRLGEQSSGVRSREEQFRDTAHGFLTWTVATLTVTIISVLLVGKALALAMSSGAAVANTAIGLVGTAGATASYNMSSDSSGGVDEDGEDQDTDNGNRNGKRGGKIDELVTYMVDVLFRSDKDSADHVEGSGSMVAKRLEAGRIFINNIHADRLPEKDQEYLAKMVSRMTDLSPQDASKRVAETFESIRHTVDEAEERLQKTAEHARKVTAHSSLWTVLVLFIGALVASGSAALGGRQRDRLLSRLAPMA